MITDKERLDWLGSMGYGIRSKYFGIRNLFVWNDGDIRNAIDCAMRRHVVFVKGNKKCVLHNSKHICGIKGQPF